MVEPSPFNLDEITLNQVTLITGDPFDSGFCCEIHSVNQVSVVVEISIQSGLGWINRIFHPH